MKDWLIKRLGGYTRTDLELSRTCLMSMHRSSIRNSQHRSNGLAEARFYQGKADAFATASRVIFDIL